MLDAAMEKQDKHKGKKRNSNVSGHPMRVPSFYRDKAQCNAKKGCCP